MLMLMNVRKEIFVYLLQSIEFEDQFYTGITDNLERRLSVHNSGGSEHTARYAPWTLVVYVGFTNEEKARAFERYMKSGSGRSFANRHFR